MQILEHKIPPPIVALLCSGMAYIIAVWTPSYTAHSVPQVCVAALFFLVGFCLDLVALRLFRKNKTTINPVAPSQSTALVTDGLYRFTRNPMYLGLVFIQLGWCTYLGAPLSLCAVVIFIAYINRFQIKPEEKVLANLFGDEYEDYCKLVRRWI